MKANKDESWLHTLAGVDGRDSEDEKNPDAQLLRRALETHRATLTSETPLLDDEFLARINSSIPWRTPRRRKGLVTALVSAGTLLAIATRILIPVDSAITRGQVEMLVDDADAAANRLVQEIATAGAQAADSRCYETIVHGWMLCLPAKIGVGGQRLLEFEFNGDVDRVLIAQGIDLKPDSKGQLVLRIKTNQGR